MTLHFDTKDLHKWAAFSGDYNPIHFELEAAARLGLQEIVVHGMLAMLPLKTSLAGLSAELYPRGARWTASLLKPVPLGAVSRAVVENSGAAGKTAFSLASDAGAKFIKGAFLPAAFDDFIGAEKGELALVPADEIDEKAKAFRADYPNVSKLWVFLDALIFYLYVKRNSANVFAVEIREYLTRSGAGGKEAERADLLVVHATHTVTISPALLHRPLTEPLPKIEYGVRGKDMIQNAGALYGVVEFTVYLDGAPSLIIEMGLMAKS